MGLTEARCAAEEATGRQYALKRMRKAAVVQCPEHVFCEQAITRNTAHPFCIRQYASFQARCPHTDCWHDLGVCLPKWWYLVAHLQRSMHAV